MIDVENLVVEQMWEDAEGKAIGVQGLLWDDIFASELRFVCSKFGVRGYKSAKKQEMIEMLSQWWLNRKVYNVLRQTTSAPRKEVQCAFRLMNLLFSGRFAAEFSSIGNIACKVELDTGGASNDMNFWENVRIAFVSPDDFLYKHLQFAETEIFSSIHHIDPSIIVNHSAKKLRSMWKVVNSNYKAALTRYTVSGMHESDFFLFCSGNLEMIYLRYLLQEKPELNGMVVADLPDPCFILSEMTSEQLKAKGIGASKDLKKRNQKLTASPTNNDVLSAIKEMGGDSGMKEELVKQKLRYFGNEENAEDRT